MDDPAGRNAWKSRILMLVAAAVLIGAVLLSMRNEDSSLSRFIRGAAHIAYFELWYVGPLFILSGYLAGRAPRSVQALLLFATLLELIAELLLDTTSTASYDLTRLHLWGLVLTFLQTATMPMLLIMLALILSQPLQPAHHWVRWTTIGLLALEKLFPYMTYFVAGGMLLAVVTLLLRLAALALVLHCAWCMAFRRASPAVRESP